MVNNYKKPATYDVRTWPELDPYNGRQVSIKFSSYARPEWEGNTIKLSRELAIRVRDAITKELEA